MKPSDCVWVCLIYIVLFGSGTYDITNGESARRISGILTDPYADWTGGDNSTGKWLGQAYRSEFIPNTKSRVPPRGLASIYFDTQSSGKFNRKNSTIRFGTSNFVLWTYVPSIIAVAYGVLWMIIDADAKRLEKYRQLFADTGSMGSSSVCLNYHCFWSPLSIVQALRYRQWVVFFSSIAYVLSFIAAPNIQSYVFHWVSYSGGTIPWGGQWAWQTFEVSPYWTRVLVGVLALILLCTIGIVIALETTKSGLDKDPRGFANVAELVANAISSDFGLDDDGNTESVASLLKRFSTQKFKLSQEHKLSMQVSLPNQTHSNTAPILSRGLSVLCLPATKTVVAIDYFIRLVEKPFANLGEWGSRSSYGTYFFCLPHICWNMFLFLLLAANTYVLAQMSLPSQMSKQNYTLPWSSNLYLLVGVFVQVMLRITESASHWLMSE